MSQVNLAGKGAIITGGGSGICLAFTKHLYQAGCNVLICDLSLHREAVQWLESLSTATPNGSAAPRVVFQKTDVTDWKQLDEAFDAYAREFGGVPSILCPGAGVYEPSAPNFWNDKDEEFYKILRINLEHPIKMSRIAIRKFLQSDQTGTIILVSSTGAQKSSILTPLYGAAKQGISNFARCMAKLKELAGIRVVAVAPGPTMSPLMYDHPEALRFVDPEKDKLASTDEIARGMMAVCFDENFPSGTVLEVTHPDRWREVFLLNDPGPAAHAWTSKKEEAIVDVIAALDADRKSLK
ncbi:uncharacterized protein Z518_07372 [Rhinocladiella mackenziei CBS 650.93]|uniref:Uncharacterized protein n=1 Tax=Rhinocladiella mackenziei CBS 650.93 TaxID=1442369 RepID=A0A0D2IDB1_9EURO|nr:uncharacterized protein Z518_07372 [Rhinocladiella mackenziei CBS 650.93]KIX03819.1 hypothetical protein Z518_07372 [Rhinocladiella mackenziei CBS 650.93]